MTRKNAAIEFLKMAGTGRVDTAYEKFIAYDFIHHNQYFRGDRRSLLDAMKQAHEASPNRDVDVYHVYEDGDKVITHSRVIRGDPSLPDFAAVHIFRFRDEQVVELWDVVQEILRESPNANGCF